MLAPPSQGQGRSHRKVHLEHVGGDVFSASSESSNRETLWSELFKEKERAAMRKHLVSRVLSFSIRDTYQISVRMMWTKEAQQLMVAQEEQVGDYHPPVAVLLHALSGPLTASWMWGKFVYPLYKANFSVILVDFPGFGLSRVNGKSDVAQSTWVERDWRIVLSLMDALRVRRCHMITCGETCNTALKMMQDARLRLEATHIFFNPVISLDHFLPMTAKPGAGQEAKTEQRHAFEKFMHNSSFKIWAVFDQSNPLTQDAYRMLCDFKELPFASDQVMVTQLTEQHVCFASAGSTVDVQILFPCRWLRHSFVRFLKCDPAFRPPASLLPEHVDAEQSTLSHTLSGVSSDRAQTATGSQSPACFLQGARASTAAPAGGLSPGGFSPGGFSPGGFSPGGSPGTPPGTGLRALSRNSSDNRFAMQALSRNWSDPGIAMQALSMNCSESRLTTADGCISMSTLSRGDSTRSDQQLFGLGPRAPVAQIRKATSLACQIRCADVKKEREGFLVNTKAVTKLKNWSEMREETAWGPGVTPEEAEWIEDALDFSMHTLETDEERRIKKPLSSDERYKAVQQMRRNGDSKKKRAGDSSRLLAGRDAPGPLDPLGATYNRDAKSTIRRMATSKGTQSTLGFF